VVWRGPGGAAISVSVSASVLSAYAFSGQGVVAWHVAEALCVVLTLQFYQLFLCYRVEPISRVVLRSERMRSPA
jgi:hypothetical protein